ncbi:MAG: hypothetical protein OEP48_09630 [Betaproteobacteria bacterium]|nr:hypothetical protein [Betaproteobacteria bacterium]MDH3435483.1 hypothetical protein [Betaproteobacteria bacterium]
MNTSKWAAILASVFALLIVGCRSAPVYNVSNAPVTSSKANLTLDDVSKAIMRAGGGLGWQMKVTKPGHILASLHLRTHVAVVDVNYSLSSYSITYKESTDLQYDGTNIHSNYNGWIQNLDRGIRTQLNLM